MSTVGTAGELMALVRSRYPLIAVESIEESRFEEMLCVVARELALPLFEWSSATGLKKWGSDGPIYETSKLVLALMNVEQLKEPTLFLFRDLQSYLSDPTVIRLIKNLVKTFPEKQSSIIFCAPSVDVPDILDHETVKITMSLPTRQELSDFAHLAVKELVAEHKIHVNVSGPDFEELISNLVGMTLFEAERALARAVLHDHELNKDDIEHVWEIKKGLVDKHVAVEYTLPRHDMSHIGGLRALKAWLAKRAGAMTAEAKAYGLEAPKGIFLLGVQGCGKSMAAKAAAREMHLPLLILDTSRLFDKYIGETEKNLDSALALAERVAPCVLMIDEIEKVLTSGGDGDTGVGTRVLGKMLSWLQDRPDGIFVVATCNDLSSIPPELVRKGRFDEIFFVDLPSLVERGEILRLHLEKRGRDSEDFDIDRLAAACEGFSGAEIEQAIISAMYSAFHDKCELDTGHLMVEITATRPLSVTKAEEVAALRAWADGRAVRAN